MPIDLPDDIELELVDGVVDVDPGHPGRAPSGEALELAFDGDLWHWRGPAPYHFISVPPDAVGRIRAIAAEVTYGWGDDPG